MQVLNVITRLFRGPTSAAPAWLNPSDLGPQEPGQCDRLGEPRDRRGSVTSRQSNCSPLKSRPAVTTFQSVGDALTVRDRCRTVATVNRVRLLHVRNLRGVATCTEVSEWL